MKILYLQCKSLTKMVRRRLSTILILSILCVIVFPSFYLKNRDDSPPLRVKVEHRGAEMPPDVNLLTSTSTTLNRESNHHKSTVDSDEDVSPEVLALSEHPNIDIRSKFQQKRISHFCMKHKLKGELRLPTNDNLAMYFRHFIFDDDHRVLFCFVPKIGCTNLKRLMLYMNGHLPLSTVEWPWVDDQHYLEPALRHVSLMNKSLNMRDKMERWNNYYKFMFVRNPLERLVSAYRNKIEPPLSYKTLMRFPEFLKADILNQYRLAEFLEWKKAHRQDSSKKPVIAVTFQEFVRMIIEEFDSEKVNEHFRPSIDICHPCLARFQFYGNFRNISDDVKQLIRKFKTEPRFYRDKSLHNSTDQTDKKLRHYYNQLSARDKYQLVGRLYDDLLFYYTLYPSQRHSHYELLGIRQAVV